MKISFNGINNYIINRDVEKPAVTSSRSQNTRNFDGITIHANITASPEKTFQDHLSQKLSMEVRQPVSSQKLEDIKNQIQSGTYEIDVNAIADKILLL